MATLAVLSLAGVAAGGSVPTLVGAAAGGDDFAAVKDKTILVVKNAHATLSRTVTFDSKAAISTGLAQVDTGVVVAALTTKEIVVDNTAWIAADTGKAAVTYSDAAADLTVGVKRVP